MTFEKLDKLDKLQTVAKPKKRRAMRGNPQPYRDGNRWKAKGYFIDLDGNPKHVTGTGSTQKAAAARRDELIKQRLKQQQENKIPDGASTVGTYCRFWLEKIKQPQDPVGYKTYKDYESVLRNWIEPNIGKIPLAELKRVQIIGLFETIKLAGKSKTVQIQVKSVLSPALQYALAEEHIVRNPYIRINLMKTQPKPPAYFEFEEASRIIQAAKTLNQELIWDIALNYGLRQGERLGLTWSDVFLDGEMPHMAISKQLQRRTGQGLIRDILKTGPSVRTLPLTEHTVALLKSQRAAYDLSRAIHGEAWNELDLVFCNSKGKPIDATGDRKNWVKLLVQANVDFRVGHTARKTTATLIDDADTAFQILGQSTHTTFIKSYRAARDFRKLNEVNKMQKRILEGQFDR